MSEEITKLSGGGAAAELENRVKSGDSAVDKVELPHGGSSGGTSGNEAVGIGGEKRNEWKEELAEKLPPVAAAGPGLRKREREEPTEPQLGDSPTGARSDAADADQTRM